VNAQPAIKRRIGIGLVAVLATLLSSACATGQQAQTAHEVPAIDATSGSVGTIALHAVAIKTPPGPAYGPGDVAQIQLVLVNTGHDTDTLQNVSTPTASGFQVFANATGASPPAGESGSASGSAASSAGRPSTPPSLDVAAGQTLSLGITDTDLVLVLRLTKTLFPGTSVPITFTFAKAGSVTLTVPTQISSGASPPGVSITAPESGASS
jgi:copper(I)-binding protein